MLEIFCKFLLQFTAQMKKKEINTKKNDEIKWFHHLIFQEPHQQYKGYLP